MSRYIAKLDLAVPVRSRGRTISEIKLRGLEPGDCETVAFDRRYPDRDAAIRLLARLAGVRVDVIADLDPLDRDRVAAALAGAL